jgi:hypothetical protein
MKKESVLLDYGGLLCLAAPCLIPVMFVCAAAMASDDRPSPKPTRTPTPQISPLPTVTPTPAPSKDSGLIDNSASFWTFKTTWDSNDTVFNEGLLRVVGLGTQPVDKTLTPLNCQVQDWYRPKTPDQVKVTLETADGRLWRAKWEEVKP